MTTNQIIVYSILAILNIASIFSLIYKLRHEKNIEGMVAMCSSMLMLMLLFVFTIEYNAEVKSKNCLEFEQVIVPRLERVIEVQDTLYRLKK